jgi:hypothetical protein
VVYGYVARNTKSPEYIAHLIDRLRGDGTGPVQPSSDGTALRD